MTEENDTIRNGINGPPNIHSITYNNAQLDGSNNFCNETDIGIGSITGASVTYNKHVSSTSGGRLQFFKGTLFFFYLLKNL